MARNLNSKAVEAVRMFKRGDETSVVVAHDVEG